MQELIIPYALVLGLSIPLWMALTTASTPVPAGQVGRFVRRSALELTADSGHHLLAYLGTTRRWRAFGLAIGLIVSIVAGLPDSLSISALPLFAGWFVGALVAEWRVLPPLAGPRRAALVAPRVLATYLPGMSRFLVPLAILLSVLIGLIGSLLVLPWTIAAVAVGLAVLFMQRRVLTRAQPLVSPDVLAVDDVIRSRSMHVLAGGGAALVLFCVLGQLSRLGMDPFPGFLGFGVVALIGWRVSRAA